MMTSINNPFAMVCLIRKSSSPVHSNKTRTRRSLPMGPSLVGSGALGPATAQRPEAQHRPAGRPALFGGGGQRFWRGQCVWVIYHDLKRPHPKWWFNYVGTAPKPPHFRQGKYENSLRCLVLYHIFACDSKNGGHFFEREGQRGPARHVRRKPLLPFAALGRKTAFGWGAGDSRRQT